MSLKSPKRKFIAKSHTRAIKLFSMGAKKASISDTNPMMAAFVKVTISFMIVNFSAKKSCLPTKQVAELTLYILRFCININRAY
jgi:hypothetical protein